MLLGRVTAGFTLLRKFVWEDEVARVERKFNLKARFRLIKLYTIFENENNIFERLKIEIFKELAEEVEVKDEKSGEIVKGLQIPTKRQKIYTSKLAEALNTIDSDISFTPLNGEDFDLVMSSADPIPNLSNHELLLFEEIFKQKDEQ